MSLMSIVKNFYIKTIPGMNAKVEDLDLKTKWVELAQNCRFEIEPGASDKREPLYHLNSTSLGANPMKGLYRYYTSAGLATWVAVNGTTAYSITDAGVSTAIRTSLTDGKRCSFVTVRNKLIVSNGYDDMWTWDGDTTNYVTWELGSCKALLASSGTALELTSDYSYRITFDEDAVVNGATSNTVTTTAISNIDVSEIPLGPVGTTDRKIYRTKADGATYFLVGYLGNNTATTFADTVTDAAIIANAAGLGHGTVGDAYPAVTDDMPKGSILKPHRERLFISGDPSNPSNIYYSNPYLPHYIQQTTNTDYMEISPDDGDEIMGIPIQLGVMVCIKKNTIRKLHVTSAVSGSDPETWYADDPMVWIGCPAQWSITQTPNGVVFLGWDHWYLFDGASAQPLFDEFDTGDILESSYSDTVGHYHNENFYAAYTDKETGSMYHNRMLVYNIKRTALSIDLWTGTNITGPNCFSARSGDDEAGDLFFGDSAAGYVVKEKDTNSVHRLRTKTECDAGTKTNVFVGGTENAPHIELGASVAASAIPTDIVIFWDNEDSSPGAGWTEITGNEDKLIKLSATAGTEVAAGTHVHTLTGSIPLYTPSLVESGDIDQAITMRSHTHEVAANADSATTLPRNIKFRMFKKNATTTEYEFPIGAIIMWDQATPPTGYYLVSGIGYYVTQDIEDLAVENGSSHSHAFSIPTSTAAGAANSNNGTEAPLQNACIRLAHTHTITGALSTETMDTWEEDYVAVAFIKRVGETETWDGTTKYCYALFASGTAASNGWAEDTTYTDRYLKIGTQEPTTGDQANTEHDHIAGTFETSTDSTPWYGGGYHTQAGSTPHTHSVILTATDEDVGTPASITFRLMKKVLGTMKDYNDAIGTKYTSGTWTSTSSQINADSLLKIYWNEDLEGSDTVLLHTRTGASQAACEVAAWSAGLTAANGSTIVSTANLWFQYKIEFTATDSRTTNPRVYFTNGYVVKYEYHGGITIAETSVNYMYAIGFRNFDEPSLDKVFKKIITKHEGESGSFTVSWETENSSGSFVIPLDTNPIYWDSFFPDDAMGKEVDFSISKNDLHSFRISELKGIYSPYQVIL